MLGHHNHDFDAAAPNGIPNAVGDYYYGQDLSRDFNFLCELAAQWKSQFASYPVLISGGVVTPPGTAWLVNITAARALVDQAIVVTDGSVVWMVPPTTRADVKTMPVYLPAQTNLDIHTGGLMNPTANGTTLNYLTLSYGETTPSNGSRVRKKKAGTYNYERTPSYSLACGPTNPAGDATKVLLATLTVTAGGVVTIVSQESQKVSEASEANSLARRDSNGNLNVLDLATFVVDSNAKLAAWAANTPGNDYTRVLIRPGTWTLASGGVNLTNAGTKVVIGLPGNQLIFSESQYGLYYTSAPSIPISNEYYMKNINIQIVSTISTANGFYRCINLEQCISDAIGLSNDGIAYLECYNIIKCKGIGTSSGGNGIGFSACYYIEDSYGKGLCSNNGSYAYGFRNCTNISNCIVVVTGTANNAGVRGYYSCDNIINCKVDSMSPNGTGYANGFGTCNYLSQCKVTQSLSSCGDEFHGYRDCKNIINSEAILTYTGASLTISTRGFTFCDNISNCITIITSSAGIAMGYNGCDGISNCQGTVTGAQSSIFGLNFCSRVVGVLIEAAGSAAGAIVGIYNCQSVVVGCESRGLNSGAGAGYGYQNCKKCQQNKGHPSGASKTATYNTCYADAGTVNAVADTAAGGYNS